MIELSHKQQLLFIKHYFVISSCIICAIFLFVLSNMTSSSTISIPPGWRKLRIHQYNTEYCILPHIIQSKSGNENRIYLLLHATRDRIDEWMIAQMKTWQGGIVVAVLVDSPAKNSKWKHQKMTKFQKRTVDMMNELFAKNNLHNIDVHFVFQMPDGITNCHHFSLFRHLPPFSTNSIHTNSTNHSQSVVFTEDGVYPVNVLRNVARMFLPQSSPITLSDSAFQFSRNFEEVIKNCIHEISNISKSVLVYRIFENRKNDWSSEYPLTMESLSDSIEKNETRVFHVETAAESHFIPGLREWLNGSLEHLFKEQKYEDASWEPQFVSLNSVPFHEEQFPFLIRDNANQRWELCRADYSFLIVHDIFAIHPGFKTKESKLKDQEKRNQLRERFQPALLSFTGHLNELYPETLQKCPQLTTKDENMPAVSRKRIPIEQIRRDREQRKRGLDSFVRALQTFEKVKNFEVKGDEDLQWYDNQSKGDQ